MKLFLIQFILLAFVGGCNSEIKDSVWEIYDLSNKEITEEGSSNDVLNGMVKGRVKGTLLVIKSDELKITGNGFDSEAAIVKVTSDEIFILENNVEYTLLYTLSDDGQTGEFTLADGTVVRAKRTE